MDDRVEPTRVTMADNGFGYQVDIPAIFIKKEDGMLLKKLHDDMNNIMDVAIPNITLNLEFPGKKS